MAVRAQRVLEEPHRFNADGSIPKKQRIKDDTSTSEYGQFLHSHGLEIDILIRVHEEEILSGVEEINRSSCREIISAAGRKLKEKESELETAKRKHAELEAKMKEITARSQFWLEHAANAEAAARGIVASLDRVLHHGSSDAESCCFEGGDRSGRSCLSCRKRDVSMLLLPCRHLCVCEECEPATETCPVCNSRKNAGLLVII